MNKIVGIDVLISYPNFSEGFIINMDTSKNEAWGSNDQKWETHCILLM